MQCLLDYSFGLRPWYQHIRRYFNIQRPEFPVSGNVRYRFLFQAPFDEAHEAFHLFILDRGFIQKDKVRSLRAEGVRH